MSVADALRQRDLETRIAALEAGGVAGVVGALAVLEARVRAIEEQTSKLTQRIASLQGTLHALRRHGSIPDTPAETVGHAASG